MDLWTESKIYHVCRRGGGDCKTSANQGGKPSLELKRWKCLSSISEGKKPVEHVNNQ